MSLKDYDKKKLEAFYETDKKYGAIFCDINESQYGIKNGKVTDSLKHYFFYNKLLTLVKTMIGGGAKVLDAGCGMGILAETVRDKAAGYIGVDISTERIKQSRDRNKSRNCFFAVSDVCSLPFGDRSFNTVVSIETIEHLPDTESFIKEVNRVLVKGGVFILSTPGNLASENNIELLYKEQHIYGFTPWGLRTILEKNGFEVMTITGIGFKSPKIKIPVWLGSDVIKYFYKKIKGVELKAGYGKAVSLQFDLMTNPLFRKFYFRAERKGPYTAVIKMLEFVGRHIPALSDTMVLTCRKR